MSKLPVIIIGAGVAGLACARELQTRGVPFLLLEQSDGVGGRVRTDQLDGFRLDRGFQILLSAYPEVKRQLDVRTLDLRPFRSGSLIRKPAEAGGGFWTWNDPFREPWTLLKTLLSPVGTFKDKLLVGYLAFRSLEVDERVFVGRAGGSSREFLRSCGFSGRFIERFFRPFLGGVFLEDKLDTSSNLLLFLFRNFLLGRACLPALGMESIPTQMAAKLRHDCLRLSTRVSTVDGTCVHLEGGEALQASEVVLATEASACARLLGQSLLENRASHATQCSYWAAPSSPLPTPMLVLNPDRSSPILNMCVPSDVAPAYAPAGQSLISVSTQSAEAPANDDVQATLRLWFGEQVNSWRHLRTYAIPEALPVFGPDARPREAKIGEHLFVCGDHTAYPSLNGAMSSGRKLGMRLG